MSGIAASLEIKREANPQRLIFQSLLCDFALTAPRGQWQPITDDLSAPPYRVALGKIFMDIWPFKTREKAILV
jgi:hypothetical protein